MLQQHTLGKTATSLWVSSDGWTSVKYHETTVIKWNEREIVLDSGGWRTATTRRRMNQASKQFNLDIRVFQAGQKWFVDVYEPSATMLLRQTLNFVDGMLIKR